MKILPYSVFSKPKTRPRTIAEASKRREDSNIKWFLPMKKYDTNGERIFIPVAERLARYKTKINNILK